MAIINGVKADIIDFDVDCFMSRCDWANGEPIYEKYHDEEWGVLVH